MEPARRRWNMAPTRRLSREPARRLWNVAPTRRRLSTEPGQRRETRDKMRERGQDKTFRLILHGFFKFKKSSANINYTIIHRICIFTVIIRSVTSFNSRVRAR